MAATQKPHRGGWAVTLKAAGRQGKPVSMTDPRYLNKYRYVSHIMQRIGVDSHYDQAIRARARQEG